MLRTTEKERYAQTRETIKLIKEIRSADMSRIWEIRKHPEFLAMSPHMTQRDTLLRNLIKLNKKFTPRSFPKIKRMFEIYKETILNVG